MGSGLQRRSGCRNDVESLEARRALPTGPIANTHALCEPARAQRRGRILRAPPGDNGSRGPRGWYAVARAGWRFPASCERGPARCLVSSLGSASLSSISVGVTGRCRPAPRERAMTVRATGPLGAHCSPPPCAFRHAPTASQARVTGLRVRPWPPRRPYAHHLMLEYTAWLLDDAFTRNFRMLFNHEDVSAVLAHPMMQLTPQRAFSSSPVSPSPHPFCADHRPRHGADGETRATAGTPRLGAGRMHVADGAEERVHGHGVGSDAHACAGKYRDNQDVRASMGHGR